MFQLCENCEGPKYEGNTIVKVKTKQEDKDKKTKSFSNWQINCQKNEFQLSKDRTQKVETIKLTMSEEVRSIFLTFLSLFVFFLL